MPVSPAALAALVQTNVNSRMGAVGGYFPMNGKITSYFIEFCQAIGKGIILGGPSIAFTTSDTGFTGTPLVAGAGVGIGITVDPTFLAQDLYTRIKNYVTADYGRTLSEPYPPSEGGYGQYTLALCQGINDALLAYYPISWALVSAHPQIYAGSGTIADGQFTGLVAPTIKTAILTAAPSFLQEGFWPRLAQAVSESYVALIEQHSTGTVTITGACAPGPSQVCSIPGTGAGSGVAT